MSSILGKMDCCGAGFEFQPYPLEDIYGNPLLKIRHGSNHSICEGKCGANSGCPYCSGRQEIGLAFCQNRTCQITWEAIRNRDGRITLLRKGEVGPIFKSQFPSSAKLAIVRRE